ncbi:MAG: Nucleotide sugar dehydrogenase, partial [Candidatus Gottesmanbacteria bacterium GW2011_GWA2_42_16]
MVIAFIGHGYVGLVTAAVFADLGNTVWIVGHTPEKIEKLKKGIMPFYEPGLEEMVRRNLAAGRIKCTLKYEEAVPESEVVFIAVGTPPKKTGEADLTAVFAAAGEIGKNLDGYTVVATKSTVPPGTNRKVGAIVASVKPDKATYDIAIVDLHKPINGKTVISNIETAEMIKYASNSLLSTKISFANAVAFLSERVGADVEKVLEGVGLDNRLGRAFLYPGVGYGGSCFPKDVKALIAIADSVGYDFQLLKSVDNINEQASKFFIKKIETVLSPIKGKTVGILGLSFKPNTDDMREAPSVKIITALQNAGAKIRAFDPVAMENAKKLLHNVT